ncbi:DUF1643 domain-containing protein [Exiguobacterium sp. SH0S1]|uniref:DUF1643 domain-containing protein n=1 Tax=Exiguobacterium sp. SH0S1 TaxID=2510949 RepID=UPI00103D2F7D|nr:DUF1643 domain-containing protein [Exiguobacterium sp. SH0S1]
MDPTMENQLVKIVESIYQQPEQLSGRFHIYNLFNLREGNSGKAIEQFESLCQANLYEVEESLATVEELQQHPWILMGWGVNKKQKWTNLQTIKQKWLHQLAQADSLVIGKMKSGTKEYYHPLPHLQMNRAAFVKDIVEIYQQQNR